MNTSTQYSITFVIQRSTGLPLNIKIEYGYVPQAGEHWQLVGRKGQEIECVVQEVKLWPASNSVLVDAYAVLKPYRGSFTRHGSIDDPDDNATIEMWTVDEDNGDDDE